MRLRLKGRAADDNPDVPLTPLIDCVFLLIVFFLVTGMFKRWEMIIPVRLPDSTSSLSANANETVTLLGVSKEGSYALGRRTLQGSEPVVRYGRTAKLEDLLAEIGKNEGPDAQIVISAHPSLPMEKLIETVDQVKLTGFQNVTVQTSVRRR